ncbi:MAG: glutamate--tRNA ligase, partial [Candidatus Nomurabacteria bacterium]|nr:glutamate--tRNA ligase [Candidatus Nomurabacteria bacterium]
NKKLGKRDGAKDAMEYLCDGILVEALDNFIASMGWNDGTEQEIFSLGELVEKFTLERVGRSGARFDENRLIWLNGQWIKKLDFDDLYERTVGNNVNFWGENGAKATDDERKKVLIVVRDRLKTLADLGQLSEYFFARPQSNWTMVDENKQLKKLSRDEQIGLLKSATEKLEKISDDDWSAENLQSNLNELLVETESKPPQLFGIIRFTLTWAPFSPGLPETMELLGKAEVIGRLDDAITSGRA